MADDLTSEHNYIFDRDNKASVRYGCALSFDIQTDFCCLWSLNYNHWLITRLSGYLLHPKVDVQSPDLCVADVGAGTG